MALLTKLRFEKKATALGTYWVSPNTKAALREALRPDDSAFFKAANLGGDPESGFESSFASLAYAYLKDKTPRLLDYIVGFQLIDRNEDNTKAVGVFGFKVGDQWLYCPVFFLNGDLKGHELLYHKNQDRFMPLDEEHVNKLIAQRPHTLGDGSALTPHQLGGLTPNLTRLARMPAGGLKYGSAQPWADGIMPLIGAAAVKAASALYGRDGVGHDLDFASVVESPYKAALAGAPVDLREVCRVPALFKLAFRLANSYPAIKAGFDKFYGPDFFADAKQHIEKDAQCLLTKAAESYILPPKDKKTGKNLIPGNKIEEVKAAEIEVIGLDVDPDAAITVNKEPLTDAEREKLLKDMVLIRDKRDPHSERNSIAYNTQVQLDLANPTESGLYSVLERPGTFDDMLVLTAPMSGDGKQNFALVIRKESPRNWKNIHATQLWAKSEGHPTGEPYKKYVDGLPGKESLEEGGMYIALNGSGEATCPFRVRSSLGNDHYRVSWQDWCSVSRNSDLPSLSREWSPSITYYDDIVVINQKDRTKLKLMNGQLFIPKEFKILTVAKPPKKEEGGCGCLLSGGDNSGEDKAPIEPGSLADIQMLLHKEATVLSVHDTGGQDVWLKMASEPAVRMTKKAALVSLVRDHGLREEPARLMLKTACEKSLKRQAAHFFVKHAYGYGYGGSLQPGPNTPAMPAPYYGSEPTGRHREVSSIYPQEEFVPVDSLSSQLTDPSMYDPFYAPDDEAVQVGQQASGSGQKEVFDTSVLGSMLKNVGQENLVERYLGPIEKAVDAFGRLLMMFYWHQEEFEDRYGKQDLPELEDGLRNAFEANGKISIFLQEKTVKGNMRGNTSVGNPEDIEPSLHEVARN